MKRSLLPKLLFPLFLLLPALGWANDLTILGVVPPQEGTDAAEAAVSVYFDYRNSLRMHIAGLQTDHCTVQIDGKQPEIVHAEMQPFVEGDMGVAVLFVFPIAKNYAEGAFGIRSNLRTLLQRMNRPTDLVTAVTYDDKALNYGWTMPGQNKLIENIDALQNTEVIEPNFFASVAPAIAAFKDLDPIRKNYVVIISDAEGMIFNDTERAASLTSQFIDTLKKHAVTPIIIAYSPDGRAAMPNIHWLQRIATQLDGYYYMAESELTFQNILINEVYNAIYSKYLLKMTLNMSGDHAIKPGNYPLKLSVHSKEGLPEDKAETSIAWPELRNGLFNFSNDFKTIFQFVFVFLAGIFIGIILMVFMRKH